MSGWTAKERQWRIIALKRRDGLRCWLCHGRFHKHDPITIDHAIPKSRGGSNALHNLRLAHLSCNGERGDIQRTEPKAAAVRAANIRLMVSA